MDKSFILNDGEYKKWNRGNPVTDGKETIPVMTSNTTPSGIASASSVFSTNFQPWLAFNGTALGNLDAWASADNQAENWIQYEFPSEVIIEKYTIQGYNLVGYEKYNPQNWRFEGYDETWEVLDTQSNQAFSLAQTREYKIQNSKPYKKYRLYITAMNGMTRVCIADIQMFDGIHPARAASWSTISDSLPTSQQFQADGMDKISGLLGRKVTQLEPIQMSNKSNILLEGEEGKVFGVTLNLKKYSDIRSMKVEVK